MSLVTYGDVKSYVENRLDLRDEGFITPSELLQYTEEALKYCEAEVHKLKIEDMYFEAEHFILVQDNIQEYALPSNIYANKILRVVYNSSGKTYPVTRITHRRRFEDAVLTDRYSATTMYRYRLINNNPVDGAKMRLHPLPNGDAPATVSFTGTTTLNSTSMTAVSSTVGVSRGMFLSGTGIRPGTRVVSTTSNTITMSQSASAAGTGTSITAVQDLWLVHYIRRVEIPVLTTDPIDFPEFWNFIAQHVVVACLKKELGNPRIAIEDAYLKELKEQMHGTLSDMVPYESNLVEADMDHYYDSNKG